jgi:hypothetical protein
MPEGPAFVQALKQLTTVNWGGTQIPSTNQNLNIAFFHEF